LEEKMMIVKNKVGLNYNYKVSKEFTEEFSKNQTIEKALLKSHYCK